MIGGPDHTFADLFAHGHIFQSGFDAVVIDGLGASLTLATLAGFGALTAADFLF